jgi:tetrahydromethanopterin S-methyltransferase subunit H
MFHFEVQQKRFKIGNIEIGGIPGKYPTVLVGSIFFRGDKSVEDSYNATINKDMAESAIRLQENFSDKTGNPCAVDVVLSAESNVYKYLDFIREVTDMPIFIDGITSDIKISALNYIEEVGIKDIIYNSISLSSTDKEFDTIKNTGVDCAVLLAMNMRNFTSEGRVNTINELIEKSRPYGIEKPLADTCILDIPSLGLGCKALFDIKNMYGIPVGNGAHNAVSTWKGLKLKMGKQAKIPSLTSANIVNVALGADYMLYGPIYHSEYIFPTVGMINAAYGQLILEQGDELSESHPRYKIS